MKPIRPPNREMLWLVFPCLMMLLGLGIINYVHIPCTRKAMDEGKRLVHHYTTQKDASAYPLRKREIMMEIALLDSVADRHENDPRNLKGALIDELYSYADSAGFATEKVEVGIVQVFKGYRETSIAIKGKSVYRATGKLLEYIENSGQSTRIRQININAQIDGTAAEVFIDLAVRETENSATEPSNP